MEPENLRNLANTLKILMKWKRHEIQSQSKPKPPYPSQPVLVSAGFPRLSTIQPHWNIKQIRKNKDVLSIAEGGLWAETVAVPFC